jgi:hypothetical protein
LDAQSKEIIMMSQLFYTDKARYSSIIPNPSQQHLTNGVFGVTNTLTPFVARDNIVSMIVHVHDLVEDSSNLPSFIVVSLSYVQLAPIDFVDT